MNNDNDNDIVPGRGHGRNSGNQYLRQLVSNRLGDYINANKERKTDIAEDIVLQVQSIGGRFLADMSGNNVMSQREAIAKTKQCFTNLKSEAQPNNNPVAIMNAHAQDVAAQQNNDQDAAVPVVQNNNAVAVIPHAQEAVAQQNNNPVQPLPSVRDNVLQAQRIINEAVQLLQPQQTRNDVQMMQSAIDKSRRMLPGAQHHNIGALQQLPPQQYNIFDFQPLLRPQQNNSDVQRQLTSAQEQTTSAQLLLVAQHNINDVRQLQSAINGALRHLIEAQQNYTATLQLLLQGESVSTGGDSMESISYSNEDMKNVLDEPVDPNVFIQDEMDL